MAPVMKEEKQKILSAADAKKEFLNLYKQLCYSRTSWKVWVDLITAFAITLSNVLEQNQERRATREKEFRQSIDNLGGPEIPTKMLGLITIALERNPEQDLLGSLFMELGLSSHWHGQYFSPYSVCQLMSSIPFAGIQEMVGEKGYATISDCCCGAGAMLIAAANNLKAAGYNYQTCGMFVAQDIDRIAGMMCYIQMALLGMPGYVVIANTLTDPVVGSGLIPAEQSGQEFWYIPMWYRDEWVMRRQLEMVSELLAG